MCWQNKSQCKFPRSWWYTSGYQFPTIRRDHNPKGGGNSFCLQRFYGTLIDLMLRNRPRSFLKSQKSEIGLSDCLKLVVSILRASFKNFWEIKSVLTRRTIFFEIWTVDYYKWSFIEIMMSLTKNLPKLLNLTKTKTSNGESCSFHD